MTRSRRRRGPSRPPSSSGTSSTPTGTAGRTRTRRGLRRVGHGRSILPATAPHGRATTRARIVSRATMSAARATDRRDRRNSERRQETPVPGKNLTRDEARERARPAVASTSYDVAPRPDHRSGRRSAPRTTVRVRAAPSPAPRPSSTSSPRSVQRGHPQRRDARPGRRSSTASRIAAARPAPPTTSSTSTPTGVYMNTGEGLHRFVDPVDDEVYLYTQFEVADSRRMFAVFEQPDLKATFALHGDRPGALDRSSRNSPTPEPDRRRGDGAERHLAFEPTPRISSLHHRARSPAPTTWCATRCQTAHGRRAARRLLPQVADRSTSTPTTSSTAPSRASTFFEDEFDLPYPFAKYDQLFTPGVQHWARWRTPAPSPSPRVYVFRVQGHRGHRSSAAR